MCWIVQHLSYFGESEATEHHHSPTALQTFQPLSPIQYNKIQQTEKVVDNEKADQWLDIAAQEAGVCHTRQDPSCRLHITARCLQTGHTWNAIAKWPA